MNNRAKELILSVMFVLGIIVTTSGSTYAYFTASVSDDGNSIDGSTYEFLVDASVTTLESGELIPVNDNLISSSLNSNDVCDDVRGYKLCSLYRIRLTNSGGAEDLVGGLTTVNSTYTTSNLKYQLFTLSNNTYTAASDALAINHTADSLNYFKFNSSNITFSLGSSSVTDYYLVIWLSDSGVNQLEDRERTFTGTVTFISSDGARISTSFITT